MYLEYDWTSLCWKPRFGDVFIAVNGIRSYPSFVDAAYELKQAGLKIGRKTDTRTWTIEVRS